MFFFSVWNTLLLLKSFIHPNNEWIQQILNQLKPCFGHGYPYAANHKTSNMTAIEPSNIIIKNKNGTGNWRSKATKGVSIVSNVSWTKHSNSRITIPKIHQSPPSIAWNECRTGSLKPFIYRLAAICVDLEDISERRAFVCRWSDFFIFTQYLYRWSCWNVIECILAGELLLFKMDSVSWFGGNRPSKNVCQIRKKNAKCLRLLGLLRWIYTIVSNEIRWYFVNGVVLLSFYARALNIPFILHPQYL